MRVKAVPTPPETREFVRDARNAVPLVPKPEGDCCARLVDRLDLPARDAARRWLTFLRGLGLAAETERGFARTRDDVDDDGLAAALLDGVFGAREIRSILDASDEPLPPDVVFDRFRSHVPQWERHKQPNAWEETWRERVADLLDWLVLFGLATRRDGRYTAR